MEFDNTIIFVFLLCSILAGQSVEVMTDYTFLCQHW